MSARAPSTYLRDTSTRVSSVLTDNPMTAHEIAQRLGGTLDGITSCLRGMVNRGEVSRLKPRLAGKPYRYRLKVAA